jgi:hypothetical protein
VCGLLGHLLEANHFVGAATGPFGELRDARYALRVAGVYQPVADAGGWQEDSGQLGIGELAATLPIFLWINVFGQSE